MRIFLLAGFLAIAACSAGAPDQAAVENVENTAVEMNDIAVDANAADNAADMNAADVNADMNMDANMADMNAMSADIEPAAGGAENAADNAGAAVTATPSPPKATAAPGPRVTCDILGERVAADDCEDARALAQDVKPGAAALDVPDPMTRGRASRVTLVIDRRTAKVIHELETSSGASSEGAAETPNQVADSLPGKDYAFASAVGRYMTASLVGEGFQVKLLSPEKPLQEIARDGQGMWIWEVVPQVAGAHVLTARTEAVAIIGNRSVPLGNGMTSKSVRVEIRKMDSIRDFLTAVPDWLKLITAILVAAAALVGAWFGLRKAMRG